MEKYRNLELWLDNSLGWLWGFYVRDTRYFTFPDFGFRAAYMDTEHAK
jgi:hypothetical protein